MYPVNPQNPDSDDLQILLLTRSTYGDSPCACQLEQVMTMHVAEKCKTALGKDIILNSRYVDDILAGDFSREVLWAAIKDIEAALEFFDFSYKMVITNGLWHTVLNPDGSAKDGSFSPSDSTEVVFHHLWNYRNDTIQNIPQFFTGKKTRGAYTGPPLPQEDISSLIITKRLFSRLSGQCYGLDGSLLSPLKACFSVIFNLICGDHLRLGPT